MTVSRLFRTGAATAVFPRNRHPLNSFEGEIGPREGGRAEFRPLIQALDSGFGLLKWLNSLYRPALPKGIRAGHCPAAFPNSSIGASPSGKAVDFDSTIRRFESSRPSQAATQPKIVCIESVEMPAN